MLGLSWGEIFIIAVLGLIILGPDELPRLAKTVMQLLNSLRRQSDDVRREFYNAVYKPADDIRREITNTLTVESLPEIKHDSTQDSPDLKTCEERTGEKSDDTKSG